jgi:hypothetical protein
MNKKKIVICASSSFDKEIIEWKEKLESKKFEVTKYPMKINDNFLSNYEKEFTEHYDAISKANILLILNLEKKGIPGYIGAGVFAEMAFAIGLNKTLNKKIEVCYLNPLFEEILPYSDELKFWQQLGWIKLFDT